MEYRIWVQIEEFDAESDHAEDADWPEELASFATLDEADAFVAALLQVTRSEAWETSDRNPAYRERMLSAIRHPRGDEGEQKGDQ